MRAIEQIKKRKEEQEKEIAERAAALDKLKQQRAALEETINAAIDADDLAEVDKLTAQESALDNRIRAAERVLERKRETASVNRVEIVAANNDDMRKYQGKTSAAFAEAEKCRRQYYENLIKAGEIIQEANAVRLEYLNLAGAMDTDSEFDSVHIGYRKPLDAWDREALNAIRPDGIPLVWLLAQ